MSPSVEVLEIPFEGARLPGYFVSGGKGKRPTLIAMGGFDSSGEEVYHWIWRAAAERGWHCLIFEGPGQRGALHLNPGLILRPDYEIPVGAVVDYVLARPEIDHERLALIGLVWGKMDSCVLVIRNLYSQINSTIFLDEINKEQTRLVMRLRANFRRDLRIFLFYVIFEPGDFVMMRKELLGIKQRVEQRNRSAYERVGAMES